jgi:hypothetical protein
MTQGGEEYQPLTVQPTRAWNRVTREPLERGVLLWTGRRLAVEAGDTEVTW